MTIDEDDLLRLGKAWLALTETEVPLLRELLLASGRPRLGASRGALTRKAIIGLSVVGGALIALPGIAHAQDAPTPESANDAVTTLGHQTNLLWVVIGAALVIFMQAGFALVETGFCRAKHAARVVRAWLERLGRPARERIVNRTEERGDLEPTGGRLVTVRIVGLAVVQGDLLIELANAGDQVDVPRRLNGQVPTELADVAEHLLEQKTRLPLWLEANGSAVLDIGVDRLRLRRLSVGDERHR